MSHNRFFKHILIIILIIFPAASYAEQEVTSLFPIHHYDQTISNWIKPNDPNYDKPLLSKHIQQKHLALFIDRYVGSKSPWSGDHVTRILHHANPDDLITLEKLILHDYNNNDKAEREIGYGENFRPHSEEWINKIRENINLEQFKNITYQASNRAITIDNLQARVLPTDDVFYFHHKYAGQGYPFDNLQMSALWIATPVYILGETKDHAWMLVLTPEYIAWVKSTGIARVNDEFVSTWIKAAKNKLGAITKTETSLVDEQGKFIALSYVGSVFPLKSVSTLIIPAKVNSHAIIKYVNVSDENVVQMPLVATPHQFANLMNTLINRPYGWGGLYFYNDCSAELKSLFTPFGIWLPRHSSQQVTVGKMEDVSNLSPEKRLDYLKKNGKPFITIIYVGGHVIMYAGHIDKTVMSYQNMWGLHPRPANRRAVIGKAVLFPIKLSYPEDRNLISHADYHYFQVSYLDQFNNYFLGKGDVTLRSLLYPED